MPQISPVGSDDALAAVSDGTIRRIYNIFPHIVGSPGDGAPTAGSWAEAVVQPGALHQPGMRFKMGIPFINPIQKNNILWQGFHTVGVFQYLIPPHHHTPVFRFAVIIDFTGIIQI